MGNFIAGGTRAATVRFPCGGTVTYRPVISGTLGGRTRVAFSIQREGAGGSVLKVASVLLPPVPTTTSAKGVPGRVSLSAPGDCLPPTLGRLKASAKAAKGWTLTKVTLKRSGREVANPSSIDGSAFGSVRTDPSVAPPRSPATGRRSR